MVQQFDVYETLARLRQRPAMYIGDHSIIRLSAFVEGCRHMAHEYGIEWSEQPPFHGFHDWVAQRFGWGESTAGWCGIILHECAGDDRKALDCFFELIDEYRTTAVTE